MASTSAPAPATAVVATNQSNMFEDDDEDTWSLLVTLDADSSDISLRLKSLAKRLEEDFNAPSEFWNGLCQNVQSLGFSYSSQPLQNNPTTEANGGSSSNYPAAFQSENGKKHIKAVSMLLGLSEARAVKITMSALRSVNGEGTNFQSLLGSRDLLMKTMLHHFHQRSARLSVVTECLRLEQTHDAIQRDAMVQFLDSLDSGFKDGDRNRGLFLRLLTIACAPAAVPTRDQLEPCKELHQSSALSLQDAVLKPQGEKGWNSFVGTCLEELHIQTGRERTEAMEALLVLLYERVDGGVRRSDYAMLLTSFQASSNFFTEKKEERRLSILAGLICAESMALWRVFSRDVNPSAGWVTGHPFLEGYMNTQVAQREMENLQVFLLNAAEAFPQRQADSMDNDDAPEALALLSFGLLLHLAATSTVVGNAQTSGMEIALAANDTYGAFDYMNIVIHELTEKASKASSTIAHDEPYDWQFSDLSKPLLLENQSQAVAGADTLAYTAIAREILAAAIATFGSKILASGDNISMLSNLAYMLYQCNTLLCDQFWEDWDIYSSSDSSTTKYPMCSLMDASYKLAVEGHEVLKRDYRASEDFVSQVAPFFRLVASLAHSPELIETTMAVLPNAMIRNCLLCCRSEAPSSQDDYKQSKIVLLESFCTLTRLGNSASCLHLLRTQLEGTSEESGIVDGPRVLSRILSTRISTEEASPVLQAMAHLLQGAPQRWVLQLAKEIIISEDTNSGLPTFMAPGGKAAHSAALVLAELIEHFTTVIFCDSLIDESAVNFLDLLKNGILSATSMLASSLSVSTSTSEGRNPLSFETAQTILQAFADFLTGIRAVCKIHRSEKVRTAAIGVRDYLINALASSTSWGHAIAYYAVVPVSLTLMIRLQDVVDDQRILQVSTASSGIGGANMGLWQAIVTPQNLGSSGKVARQTLLDFAEKMKPEDFDLEGIQARGWANETDEAAPIDSAWSAIRLLSAWASHVEDIAQSHSISSDFFDSMSTDSNTKSLIDALSPQRLLTSLASSPIPCRESSILSSAWKDVGLSHFDLLLPYLAQAEGAKSLSFKAPASATLDFLQACVAHVRSSRPPETAADSMLFRAIYRSSRFPGLMKAIIGRSIASAKQTSSSRSQNSEVCNGLLSLRIMSSCVEASASVADKLLHLDAVPALVPELIEAACEGLKILSSMEGSRTALDNEGSVIQLRIALGCLDLMSAVWKTAFRSLRVREDEVRSRLCRVVEEQRSFIMKLVTAVSLYGTGNGEASIVSSWISEHARCTMKLFVSTAFDILTTELAYSVSASAVDVNDALKNLLLVDFLNCERFARYDGYQYAAEISGSVDSTGIHSRINGCQLIEVLKCYPSTSSQHLLKDFYNTENSFDVSASMRLLTTMGVVNIEEVEDVLPKMAISYQTTLCELQMMSSWKKFAESTSIFFSGPLEVEHAKSSLRKERLFDFACTTINALCQNVADIEKAHGESTKGFLKNECVQMVGLLSRLFLYFLDLSLGGSAEPYVPQTAILLNVLGLVVKSSEIVFSLIAEASERGAAPTEVLETCCKLECPLLASAAIILGFSEQETGSSIDEFRNSRDSLYNSICRANGRVLGVLVDLLKGAKKHADVLSLSPENRDLLRCCISLSTAVVARGQGTGLSESRYYNMVAETFQEYEIPQRLLQLGISSSHLAISAQECVMDSKPTKAFLWHIDVVKSILSLLYSVAETNDRTMLEILPKILLARFLARNPLFSFASENWTQSGLDANRKRGYIVLDASKTAPVEGGVSIVHHFHIGINDPVHEILLDSLTVMQVALRSSSCWLNPQSNGPSTKFFDIAVEFLITHKDMLLNCLKSTGTRLTRHVLLESNHTLSLVAELCKRDIRDSFLLSNGSLCEEFFNWAKFVVVSTSKFLSASGTSRELFLAITEYESESEEMTDERLSHLRLKHRHPLLADGLPSAKHEAVKYSHFASRLCERVTESDFKDSTTVPSYLNNLAKDREHESDLERNCRLSVTCNFAIDIERTAADCLSQAVSLIWRVHPTSFGFQTFSLAEVQNMDAMLIVRPGAIIGFRPCVGDGALSEYPNRSSLFKSLRFGKVRSSNTITRTWEVEALHRPEEKATDQYTVEMVKVQQLAGIEDPSMRKAVTLYRPAGVGVAALDSHNGVLSVGDLILILRWCHQESLSKSQSGQLSEHGAIRRVVEQTVALLGAELALHEEIGSSVHLSKAERSRLDAQIFELFADQEILASANNAKNALPVRYNTTGRLKGIVDDATLRAVRPQVEPSVMRAWQEMQDKERRRREKPTYSHDTTWFSSGSRKRYGQKSAFRGLG